MLSRDSYRPQPDPQTYRPELDGLRALSVAAVLLYHLDLPWVSGGYVGVDVFFVISGFLITRAIRHDLDSNSFRLGEFYVRRLRRLFPALFTTIALSFFVASLLFPAARLSRFAAEALASLPALSNFYFWSDSGYFEAASWSKPLLHTWSLGVEEQFYLLCPIALVALHRLVHRMIPIIAIVVVAIGSFALAEYWIGFDPAAAFFLLPARVGEFAIGALAVSADGALRPDHKARPAATAVGLFAILFAVATFDETTRFPGISALVPCLGAALVILGRQNALSLPALQNPASVAVGRLSYSLYLVHWPIFVFYRMASKPPFGFLECLALLVASVAAATLLHTQVEKRFRLGTREPRAARGRDRFPIAAALACLVLSLLLNDAYVSHGWKWRYPNLAVELGSPDIAEDELNSWKTISEIEGRPFGDTAQRVLVIGDSQAGDFIHILLESGAVSKSELSSAIVRVRCGSLFVDESRQAAYFEENRRIQEARNTREWLPVCREQWDAVFAGDRLAQATHVYVSNIWYDYQLPYLADAARKLAAHTDAEIRFVGNKILSEKPQGLIGRCFGPQWRLGSYCGSRRELNAHARRLLTNEEIVLARAMKQEVTREGVEFVDMHAVVCPGLNRCRVLGESGKPVFYDAVHTTRTGNRELGRLFREENVHVGQIARVSP